MTPERYYAVVAERALTSGRPLDVALEDAARIAPPMPSLVRLAIDRARAGNLHNALAALEAAGLGPLVSQAAEISPRATRAVRERLDALPERLQFTWPFRHDLSYFVVLFLAQAGVATVLTLKVLPSLTRIRAAASFEIVDFAATVATALAFVGVLLATPLGNLVVRRALKDLRAAAVHAAAAGLAAAGVAGDAQRLLALHPEIGPSSANALTAISLDEISRQLVYRAQRSAARALLYTKLVGTALALGIALAIIGPVYAAIPALAKGISLP